ncbi:hypothetical protein [Aeromonas caviae]|uniref:hypothetical protein n=1 Tax=Aeromonas caviae TaxID=648 RepID=UPI0039F5C6CE
MSTYFFGGISQSHMTRFVAVRDTYSNLENLLNVIDIINSSPDSRVDNSMGFDLAIFTGDVKRVLVRKPDGFFTMSLPFQLIDHGYNIVFNYDEFGLTMDTATIFYLRNAINTCREGTYCNDSVVYSLHESFGLDFNEAIIYSDMLSSLLLKEHGYFRFDDDVVNSNAKIHPRYHFDFFCTNSSGIKIGIERNVDGPFFINLFDLTKDRPYIFK